MRISNGYPDPLIGCTMFPEDVTPDEFGYGVDVPAAVAPAPRLTIDDVKSGLDVPSIGDKKSQPRKPSIDSVGSGLDTPTPRPRGPADLDRIRSGL